MEGERIMPFLWVREGDGDKIEREIHRIYDTGARAFCVESRPHMGFGTDSWWHDMDIAVHTAEKLGMKLWLLDDLCFPTGYANGAIEKKYPELRHWHIAEFAMDVAGPMDGAKVLLQSDIEHKNEEFILSVVAFPRHKNRTDWTSGIDLTDHVRGDFLYWDVPEGLWTVLSISKTRAGGERPNYIDMMNPNSVDKLIEAVYEPHYARYKDYFGKTFAGFFSDEPRLGNWLYDGSYDPPNIYCYTLGNEGVAYPWNDELVKALSERVKNFTPADLAALWFDTGDRTAEIRHAFMDEVTDAYSKNFTQKLGDWCRAHGVLYSGHIIEDMGAHARTGCSAGHYFKSMRGADIAGVDVVLHQIQPAFTESRHRAPICGGFADPTFFNYTLAKLASSASHIDENTKGRALCEVFGAYGWGEGIRTMKWIADHMLVRGINYYIPHAFSLRYPDADCPPHFSGCGNNPAYDAYKVLSHYMCDMLRALSGKKPVISVAVLYHADAEWSGKPYMPTDVVAKALMERQIDFDIVPAYALLESAPKDGKWKVGGAEYSCLIVPESGFLPRALTEKLSSVSKQFPVLYVGKNAPFEGARNVRLAQLGGTLLKNGWFDVRMERQEKDLRVLHCKDKDEHLLMLFNEGSKRIENRMKVPFARSCRDYFDTGAHYTALKDGWLDIELEPGHSVLYSLSSWPGEKAKKTPLVPGREIKEFDLYARAVGEADFTYRKKIAVGTDINGKDEMPDFTGNVQYKADVALQEGEDWIEIAFSGEMCTVSMDGKILQQSIVSPFRVNIDELSRKEHLLTLQISNTLIYRNHDNFSRYCAIPKTALEKVQFAKKAD